MPVERQRERRNAAGSAKKQSMLTPRDPRAFSAAFSSKPGDEAPAAARPWGFGSAGGNFATKMNTSVSGVKDLAFFRDGAAR